MTFAKYGRQFVFLAGQVFEVCLFAGLAFSSRPFGPRGLLLSSLTVLTLESVT